EKNIRQSISLLLAVMHRVDDCGHMVLGPLNCEREARDQYDDRMWIHRIHLLYQFFLLESDRLPINGFFAVARQRTLRPTRVASGMISNDYDSHVGGARNLHRGVIGIVADEVNFHGVPQLVPDSLDRADRV